MAHPSEQIRFCTSRDGTRIAYATCGKGPPLLWAQHWVHHIELDWNSPIWRHWLALLTRRHTVIRYDWRGCGLSDRDQVEFSSERYVEDLEAVVEAADVERFALVGVSNGAMFGAAYAVRHPERVSHLALVACQACGRLGINPSPEQVESLGAWLKVIELGWPGDHLVYGQFFTSLHIAEAAAEQKRAYGDLFRRTTSAANAIALIRTFARSDLRETLPRIGCPTLTLHSVGDPLIPFDDGRAVARLIPGARLVPLESRNHILLENEPAWLQFNEALDGFLPARRGDTASNLDDLTARERDILEAVAQGLDNNTTAMRLKISAKTVRNHVSIIFSKLGVNSRAQAIVLARDAGFGHRSDRPSREV